MKRHFLQLASPLVVTTLLSACATTEQTPSVLGRSVVVVPQAQGPKVRGELLAVAEDQVVLQTKEGLHNVPIPQIREVRVRRHWFDSRRAWTWTLIGALVSGVGLGAACSSVEGEDNCAARGFILGALPWLVFGGLSSLDQSAFLTVDGREGDRLRPFARYPQGLPSGFDLHGLEKQPAPKR